MQPASAEQRNTAGDRVEALTDEEWASAAAKLARTWSILGFTHFANNVWILALTLNTLATQMRTIREQHGL